MLHTELAGDLGGDLGADGPVGVADVVLQLHLLAEIEQRLGRSDDPAYALALNITTRQERLAINRAGETTRFDLVGVADYTLRDLSSGAIVAAGKAENFTGYSATGTTVVTLASQQDAEKRLMAILAEQIVTRLYTADLTP